MTKLLSPLSSLIQIKLIPSKLNSDGIQNTIYLIEKCCVKLEPFKMLAEMKHISYVIQLKDFSPEWIGPLIFQFVFWNHVMSSYNLSKCCLRWNTFHMSYKWEIFPQSECSHEHFNSYFGTLLCQVTTFQNVGWDETLFTCHTSERFFPRVNLTMNILTFKRQFQMFMVRFTMGKNPSLVWQVKSVSSQPTFWKVATWQDMVLKGKF